ncbi:hypothetical protein [Streptomyces sp. NPDC097619]|uniref:hypothetical protein n=1 Tax=Streptomyces sp. NPDC097619 TaxID=3157228 RepID=UPI00331E5C19
MSARRPLLTAIGAGTLLTALWFVPSANATTDHVVAAPASRQTAAATPSGMIDSEVSGQLALAETGGVDPTPYLLGGTVCLGVGAGCVVFSVRRSRGR